MTKTTEEIEMLTVAQAAEFLGVCRETIDRWAADGRFPFYKLGDHKTALVRYKKSELVEYVNSCQVDISQEVDTLRNG